MDGDQPPSGDHAVQERIIGLLAEGAPVDRVVELVPEIGARRHPRQPYAVGFDGPRLPRQVVGRPVACDLLRALVRLAPWDRAGGRRTRLIRGRAADLDSPGRELAAEAGCTDWVLLPIGAGDGTSGAIATGWTGPGGPPVAAVEACVRTMGRSTALIVQWHLQHDASERAATRDPLTGVANRGCLLDRLGAALDRAPDEPVALLRLDLDHFGAVNAAHGHAVGDAVLVAAVRRVEGVLRPGSVLGRIDGDELAVVCTGLDAEGAAEAMARAAIAALRPPIRVGALDVGVAASVGVAVTDRSGAAPRDVDDLLARADGALRVAKGAGGGRMVVTCSPGGLDVREVGAALGR